MLWAVTLSNINEICPLAIPNQISTISMHIPSLVKIHWCLLKLSSGNENMGVSRADSSVKHWGHLPISIPKPELHNINAHTQVMTTDEHMDVQRETIISRHYRVAGYKKLINKKCLGMDFFPIGLVTGPRPVILAWANTSILRSIPLPLDL